jgi:hypothetical protein
MNDVEQIMKQEYYRNCILTIEKTLTEHPERIFGNQDIVTAQGDNPICPLKHSFADGMYVREIFIPKGCLIVGKIHKHNHPNFLLKGKVRILTEFEGESILEAPMSIISKAGTKRALFTLEDTVWVTVHLNPNGHTQICDELENEIIAENYSEIECAERKAVA